MIYIAISDDDRKMFFVRDVNEGMEWAKDMDRMIDSTRFQICDASPNYIR